MPKPGYQPPPPRQPPPPKPAPPRQPPPPPPHRACAVFDDAIAVAAIHTAAIRAVTIFLITPPRLRRTVQLRRIDRDQRGGSSRVQSLPPVSLSTLRRISSSSRLRSSISPPLLAAGFSGSGAAPPPRLSRRANGVNMAKARSNISMFRRTVSSSAPNGLPPKACAIWLRNFSCSRVSDSMETSR